MCILLILYYNIPTYRKIGLVHEKICRFKYYYIPPSIPRVCVCIQITYPPQTHVSVFLESKEHNMTSIFTTNRFISIKVKGAGSSARVPKCYDSSD